MRAREGGVRGDVAANRPRVGYRSAHEIRIRLRAIQP